MLVMSKFVIYLKLEKHLKQFLENSLGAPVQFPINSNENAVIRTYIQRLPPNRVPDVPTDEDTAIYIPDSKAKPSEYYNYFGPKAKNVLIACIRDMFKRSLWAELSQMPMDEGIATKIIAWCEMHGIDTEYADTVRQQYYRMRDAYNKKGIFLGKKIVLK